MNPLAALEKLIEVNRKWRDQEMPDGLYSAHCMEFVPQAEPLLAHVKQLEAGKKRMEECLGWYADPIMHEPTQMRHPQTAASGDGGQRAREAIKPKGETL